MSTKTPSPNQADSKICDRNSMPHQTHSTPSSPTQLMVRGRMLYALLMPDMIYETFLLHATVALAQRSLNGKFDYKCLIQSDGDVSFSINLAIALMHNCKTPFRRLMTYVPLMEAASGDHSQYDLNVALVSCLDLMRDHEKNEVDLRKLYKFFDVREPFSLWSSKFAKSVDKIEDDDYILSKKIVRSYAKPGVLPKLRWEFTVSPQLAIAIAISQRGSRAAILRNYLCKRADVTDPDGSEFIKIFIKGGIPYSTN